MLETEISLFETAASPQQKCTRAEKNEFIKKKRVLDVHSACALLL